MAKNILQETKERMQEMQTAKAAQLDTIRKKQEEARTQILTAGLAMKQATEEMDVDRYAEAKARKRKGQTALDMYTARFEQIRKQEYINEQESDEVIDSLLKYEAQLEEDFKAAAGVQLKKLAELLAGYMEAVKDTEDTIAAWGRDIHANYSTRGASSFTDPVTGELTDRSPAPVPVRRMAYVGCKEALQLDEYLKTAANLIKQ